MSGILIPNGYTKSIPYGKFTYWGLKCDHHRVQTIDETRRARLEILVRRHGGKLANLNEALGYERTHTQLARIRNKNNRTDRPGKGYVMGDQQARDIEEKLGLEHGWMDTPPTYAELHGEQDPRSKALILMDALPPDQWDTALRLLDALAKPTQENGTTGG